MVFEFASMNNGRINWMNKQIGHYRTSRDKYISSKKRWICDNNSSLDFRKYMVFNKIDYRYFVSFLFFVFCCCCFFFFFCFFIFNGISAIVDYSKPKPPLKKNSSDIVPRPKLVADKGVHTFP